MTKLEKLVAGYKDFHQKYFVEDHELYARLARGGQVPSIAMVACSDSRVDPSIITNAQPGDLFVVRNVANLIPPYQPDSAYHGTSAALEFAVQGLGVEHIIVCGHRHCAGIRHLMTQPGKHENSEQSFVNSWMRIVDDVKDEVCSHHSHLEASEQAHLCERMAIEHSLQNLRSFPWISGRVDAGKLALHGWYLDIEEGMLYTFDHDAGTWEAIR